MEISPRLEDALVEYLKIKVASTNKMMAQMDEEVANRKLMLERFADLLANGDVEVSGADDVRDIIFGDDDEDSGD